VGPRPILDGLSLKLTQNLCRILPVQYCEGEGSSEWLPGTRFCPPGAESATSPQMRSPLQQNYVYRQVDSRMNCTVQWRLVIILVNCTVQWLLVIILVNSPLVSSELKSLVGPPSQLDVWPVPVLQVRAASSPITHSHVFVSG